MVCRMLLRSSGNNKQGLDSQIDNWTTPVFIATRHGHIETARLLGELGADINIARNDGVTPVFMAVQP